MRQLPQDAKIVSARIRVTLDCPECASPIPINGIVPRVLCAACQTVVTLENNLGWDRILTYQSGEPCMEHDTLMNSNTVRALDYYLAFDAGGGSLYRKWRHVLLEVDDVPPVCLHCGAPLDAQALGREAIREGANVDAFCTGCGGAIPIRVPTRADREATHAQCVAIVSETAIVGDLHEPEVAETILFSCLGCGAPLDVDATVPRMLRCKFCEATSYIPDALWLRMHPAQRKRPFYVLLVSNTDIRTNAKRALHS